MNISGRAINKTASKQWLHSLLSPHPTPTPLQKEENNMKKCEKVGFFTAFKRVRS